MGHVHGAVPSAPAFPASLPDSDNTTLSSPALASLASTTAASNAASSPSGPFFSPAFQGLYFLFSAFPLTSQAHLNVACFVAFLICAVERALTFVLNRRAYSSDAAASTGIQDAWMLAQRAVLYTLLVFLRYTLMLLAMTFNIALFVTIVLGLGLAQAVVEWLQLREARAQRRNRSLAAGSEAGGGKSGARLVLTGNGGDGCH